MQSDGSNLTGGHFVTGCRWVKIGANAFVGYFSLSYMINDLTIP